MIKLKTLLLEVNNRNVYSSLSKYKGQKDIFCHFSSINNVSINFKSEYKRTPSGVYAHSIDFVLEDLESYFSGKLLQGFTHLPYCHILKKTSTNGIDNLKNMTKEDFYDYISKIFPNVRNEVKDRISGSIVIGQFFYDYVLNIVQRSKAKNLSNLLNILFRKMGIEYIYDDYSIIYPGDAEQIVFLTPLSYKHIETLINKYKNKKNLYSTLSSDFDRNLNMIQQYAKDRNLNLDDLLIRFFSEDMGAGAYKGINVIINNIPYTLLFTWGDKKYRSILSNYTNNPKVFSVFDDAVNKTIGENFLKYDSIKRHINEKRNRGRKKDYRYSSFFGRTMIRRPGINEIDYPLAKGADLQSYEGQEGWKGKLVWMTPDQFLKLAIPLYVDWEKKYRSEQWEKLKDRISKGLPMDFLVLEVDMEKRKVIGHEGRHRAHIAKELGIEKVPVLIYTGSKFKRVPQWSPEDHYAVGDVHNFEPEYGYK